VPRTVHQLRAVVSALLLLVQALGLGHLALAEHTVGEAGAQLEVALEGASGTAEVHSESAPHVCASDGVVHDDAPLACMVVAAWTAPSATTPRALLGVAARADAGCVTSASVVPPQFDALSRAPKASPPRVG